MPVDVLQERLYRVWFPRGSRATQCSTLITFVALGSKSKELCLSKCRPLRPQKRMLLPLAPYKL